MKCPICHGSMMLYCFVCNLWNGSELESKKHTKDSAEYCKVYRKIGRYEIRGDNTKTTIRRENSNSVEEQVVNIGIGLLMKLKPRDFRKWWDKFDELEKLSVLF